MEDLKKHLEEYLVIEERIKGNIERATRYRDLDDTVHQANVDKGNADLMSLMQAQSQVIRLSDYIDQQYMTLVEIQRQRMELELEIEQKKNEKENK